MEILRRDGFFSFFQRARRSHDLAVHGSSAVLGGGFVDFGDLHFQRALAVGDLDHVAELFGSISL